MGGLFEPIFMQSRMKGASPPEKMNWMHADLQIEVEKGFSSMIEKRPSGMPGAVFFCTKKQSFYQSRVESHKLPLFLCVFKE